MKQDSKMNIHMGLFTGTSARMVIFLFLVVFTGPPALSAEMIEADQTAEPSVVAVDDFAGPYRPISKQTELELFGTLSLNPDVARVIIENITTRNLSPYGIGHIWIEAISEESADFSDGAKSTNSNFETGFPGDDSAEVVSTTVSYEEPGTEEADLPPDNGRMYIRVKRKHMEKMLRKSVIKLYSIGSRVEGLRITGLNKQKGAGGLGLKDGDVIRSVNGHRLTSKGKAYRVFQKTKSLPVINIELLRGGEIKRLRFAFQ